jgi:hypothetical protein
MCIIKRSILIARFISLSRAFQLPFVHLSPNFPAYRPLQSQISALRDIIPPRTHYQFINWPHYREPGCCGGDAHARALYGRGVAVQQ